MLIGTALGEQVEVAEPVMERLDDLGAVLAPVRLSVEVGEPHASTDHSGERRVQRQVLFATDDTDG